MSNETASVMTDEEKVARREKFDIELEIELAGPDGNAFMVLGLVDRALHKAGATKEERKEFTDEAMSGDYENLLKVVGEWVYLNDY